MMNQQLEKKNSKTSLRLHYLMLQRLLPVVCSDCLHIFLIKMFFFLFEGITIVTFLRTWMIVHCSLNN